MAKETLIARIRRLMAGSMQDLMDRLELRNAETVMRQAIREVDDAIAELEDEIGRVAARVAQLERHGKWLQEKKAEIAERIHVALEEGREDLARAAVSREMTLERQIEETRRELKAQMREREELEHLHDSLLERRAEMVRRFREWLDAQRHAAQMEEAFAGRPAGQRNAAEAMRRRVDRAEQAMVRVASGGLIDPSLEEDLKDAAAITEINNMARQREIDRRLAAYKKDVTVEA